MGEPCHRTAAVHEQGMAKALRGVCENAFHQEKMQEN